MALKLRLAVLIDGENISGHIADALFADIAERGKARLRRVYGDFTNPCVKTWMAPVAKHAIVARQVFNVTKNAVDIALIMDATELLISNQFDGFCIVSSDAHFTHLANRIREKGLVVFGFGNPNTTSEFRDSCTKFVETSELQRDRIAV
ncbi:MAG TPA: NYN domain-containing protein [Rhizomicrobium sp.]|nr:NYN domain-containing protein [Rhizomicrobium sp.]